MARKEGPGGRLVRTGARNPRREMRRLHVHDAGRPRSTQAFRRSTAEQSPEQTDVRARRRLERVFGLRQVYRCSDVSTKVPADGDAAAARTISPFTEGRAARTRATSEARPRRTSSCTFVSSRPSATGGSPHALASASRDSTTRKGDSKSTAVPMRAASGPVSYTHLTLPTNREV